MSADKLVDSTQLDADLTSVANAIRTKGGTSAQLAFPAGFVQAINDISGGSVTMTGLSATYTQSGVVGDDEDLSVLTKDLVVVATFNNSTSIEVAPSDYTLSGTLTVGTSTITVSCGGLSDTFSVTVTKVWDYVWTYKDGKLTDNGWELVDNNADGIERLTNDGLEIIITSSATNAYMRLTPTNALPNAGIMTKGVMEVVFGFSAINNYNGVRLRLSNGTSGAATISSAAGNYGGMFRVYDNTNAANCTPIAVARTGTEYKQKIMLMSNSEASYYLNDTLEWSALSTSNIQYANATSLYYQGVKGTLLLKSIKIKVERTS